MPFDQVLVVLVGPQHPFPVGVLFAAGVAPASEFGGQLGGRPTLVEKLGDRLKVPGNGSLHEFLGSQVCGVSVGASRQRPRSITLACEVQGGNGRDGHKDDPSHHLAATVELLERVHGPVGRRFHVWLSSRTIVQECLFSLLLVRCLCTKKTTRGLSVRPWEMVGRPGERINTTLVLMSPRQKRLKVLSCARTVVRAREVRGQGRTEGGHLLHGSRTQLKELMGRRKGGGQLSG